MNDRKEKAIYISNKIKELRNSVGWSQSELARRADVTNAAISQIEKGDRLPSFIVSRKIAEAFNISVAELTGDSSLSTTEINEEAQVFFRKFGDLSGLSKTDQEMIKTIIARLKERANGKC